jgi:hypothetical protein
MRHPLAHPLSPLALRAVQHAYWLASAAGRLDAIPMDLLGGLLQDRDTAAGLLLARLGVEVETLRRSVVSPPARYQEAAALAAAAHAILDTACRIAFDTGHKVAGTDHLLLALASAREDPVAVTLAERGITPERLHAEASLLAEQQREGTAPPRHPGELASEEFPSAVRLVSWAAVLSLLSCPIQIALPVFLTSAAGALLGLLGWAWLAALTCVGPTRHRRPSGWATVQSVVFVKTGGACAFALWAVLTQVRGGWIPTKVVLPSVVYAALGLGLTASFFQARGWYGVRSREGWKTMVRDGGWALGITALLEVGWLVGLILGRR